MISKINFYYIFIAGNSIEVIFSVTLVNIKLFFRNSEVIFLVITSIFGRPEDHEPNNMSK